MVLDKISEYLCFEGLQQRFSHYSETLKCKMNFSIYLPPEANSGSVPVVYWLSGLTCTDENFVQKAGAQRYASELGIALVAPDTSPRGDNVPDDPLGEYDFGLGAGFPLASLAARFGRTEEAILVSLSALSRFYINNQPPKD